MSQIPSFRPRGRLPANGCLFTPDQAREIRSRYRDGENAMALARAYETNDRTIRIILRGRGAYPLAPGEAPVTMRSAAEELASIARRNREAVAALHAQGMTSDEVREASGLSMSTVWVIGRELGLRWPRRPAPPKHGTPSGYKRCGPPKCAACRAANTKRHHRYSAARRRAD